MEERALKRLLIILAASIIAIVLIKIGLTKTYTALNKAAAEKKQAAAARPSTPQQAPAPPASSELPETPTASTASVAATMDSPASSSVSEAR